MALQYSLQTPAAAVLSYTEKYDYAAGQYLAQTVIAPARPALEWIALLNPANPHWQTEGSLLWAIWPIMKWLLFPVVVGFSLIFKGFFLWILDWIIKIWKIITDLIELIPGE